MKYETYLHAFTEDSATPSSCQAADVPTVAFMGGKHMEGSAFCAGYYVLTRPGELLSGSHRHEQDEYLMFGTPDLSKSAWDGELTLVLGEGEEAELLHITAPTTIRIPAGLAHGPLRLLRVGKPILYQPAYLGEHYAAALWETTETTAALNRYERLVFVNCPERKGNYIDGSKIQENNDEVGIGFRGACQIAGATANLGGSLITAPLFIDPYPHKHPSDEYLAFMGRPEAPFDFDAEIRFTLGNGEDAEEFTITRPTIVRIPAGTWHCPLNFYRIGKPVYFQVNMLHGAFGGAYQMPNGLRELYFNGLISCIMEPEKNCDCCHRCLQWDWKKETH